MRLIDADKLVKKIREVDFVADAEQMEITHDSMMTGFFHGRVQGIVDYLPTAYDIDKVVEQLEEKVKEINDFCSVTYEGDIFVDARREALLEAIEIVKGGVADET